MKKSRFTAWCQTRGKGHRDQANLFFQVIANCYDKGAAPWIRTTIRYLEMLLSVPLTTIVQGQLSKRNLPVIFGTGIHAPALDGAA